MGCVDRCSGRVVDIFDSDTDACPGGFTEKLSEPPLGLLIKLGGLECVFLELFHLAGRCLGYVHGEAIDTRFKRTFKVYPKGIFAFDSAGVWIPC